MATLAAYRIRLRRWLEDESVSPLWSDEQLTEALAAGLSEVSLVAPWIVSEERTAAPGTLSFDLPVTYQRLLRLYDPTGVVIAYDLVAAEIRPRDGGPFDPGDYLLTYEMTLQMPASDSGELPCPLQFESLLLAAAAYWSLSQRATAEAKRGGVTTAEKARIEATRQDLDTLRKQARRTVHYLTLGL